MDKWLNCNVIQVFLFLLNYLPPASSVFKSLHVEYFFRLLATIQGRKLSSASIASSVVAQLPKHKRETIFEFAVCKMQMQFANSYARPIL